jgi:hypothetical protein
MFKVLDNMVNSIRFFEHKKDKKSTLDSMIKETYNQFKDNNIHYEFIETMLENKGFLQDKENLKLDFDKALSKLVKVR